MLSRKYLLFTLTGILIAISIACTVTIAPENSNLASNIQTSKTNPAPLGTDIFDETSGIRVVINSVAWTGGDAVDIISAEDGNMIVALRLTIECTKPADQKCTYWPANLELTGLDENTDNRNLASFLNEKYFGEYVSVTSFYGQSNLTGAAAFEVTKDSKGLILIFEGEYYLIPDPQYAGGN